MKAAIIMILAICVFSCSFTMKLDPFPKEPRQIVDGEIGRSVEIEKIATETVK